jgi:hypothetical protein
MQKVEPDISSVISLTSDDSSGILLHVIKLLSKMTTKNLAFENSHFQKQDMHQTSILYCFLEILQELSEAERRNLFFVQ